MHEEDVRAGRRKLFVNALACLVHRAPGILSLFPATRAALRCCKWATPSRHYAPMTKALLIAFIAYLFASGEVSIAILMLISWSRYIRAREVICLTIKDVARPGDNRLVSSPRHAAGVRIAHVKTRIDQFVLVKDWDMVIMIFSYIEHLVSQGREETVKLFSYSYSEFLGIVKYCAKALGVDAHRFTTPSLRYGRALHDYHGGESSETIADTGRWHSLKTLQGYLVGERSDLMTLNFPKETGRTF